MRFASVRNSPLEKHLSKVNIDPVIVKLSHKYIKNPKHIKESVEKIGDYKPDIFWLMKDQHLSMKLLYRLKRVHPKMKFIMWYGDQRGYQVVPLIRSRIPILDGLFITNGCKKQRKMYQQAGINYVRTFYHSFSTEEFKLWKIPVNYEVFFGGSRFKHDKFPLCKLRYKFITAVHNNFKLVVHGGGWPFKTFKWKLRPHYAKSLRKAHINLGINHYSLTRYYNRRLFESVGSGRLHITHYIPGMEQHFINKKHLVWFKSINEGIKYIRHYLERPKERERIAKRGREFFIKHHSWDVRIKELKGLLERIL